MSDPSHDGHAYATQLRAPVMAVLSATMSPGGGQPMTPSERRELEANVGALRACVDHLSFLLDRTSEVPVATLTVPPGDSKV